MRGVVLAGGTGSRLNPLTRVMNKHLLPVFNKPMVYYPIQTLVNAGIQEILLVTGGKNAGDFLRLLENGRDFGLKHLNYTPIKKAKVGSLRRASPDFSDCLGVQPKRPEFLTLDSPPCNTTNGTARGERSSRCTDLESRGGLRDFDNFGGTLRSRTWSGIVRGSKQDLSHDRRRRDELVRVRQGDS